MKRISIVIALAVFVIAAADPPRSLRLYVFDCGTLDVADTGRYRLKREEVAVDKLSVGCYLVAHPRGVLMWDTGAVPDGMVKSSATAARYHLELPVSSATSRSPVR